MHIKLAWQHKSLPMQLLKYEQDIPDVAKVRQELERYITTQSDRKSMTWGYFPELSPDDAQYPHCVKFAKIFYDNVVQHNTDLQGIDLQLAFIRLATQEPQSDFGGMHIDASSGISHVWPKNISPTHEVLRLLFNLGTKPRKLEYCSLDRQQLAKAGFTIPRDHYEILDIASDIPLETVELPPIEHGAVYGLQFVSTRIPHAGRTNNDGHFLTSYGGYIDNQNLAKVFVK